MATPTIIEQLGFVRAVSVNSDYLKMSDSRSDILKQVKSFRIDEVYFCDDENGISYPAVFIKKVDSFDNKTLEDIAKAHRMIWNFKKVLFLYVFNDTEIRIYNCAEKPITIKKTNTDYESELRDLELANSPASDKKKFDSLIKVFSSISIDTGIIWTMEEAASVRKKINLQRRVDKYLVNSLINTARQLQDDGLNISLIHKIIMRSLFLLYLEDREATDEKFYAGIKTGAKSYFDILNDVKSTYALFKRLEERFNGNVFTLDNEEKITREHLQLIKKCFISGNDGTPQTQLFDDWRMFDFKIIQIELLSEIYENFLAKIEPDIIQQTGTHYTPPSLVELILNEKLSTGKKDIQYNFKILDPACGSGIFLVESFKRLVKRYENKHGEKLTDFDTLKQLLTGNIFGIELHQQSIKIAAFSLYLALVDNLNPKTIWQEDNKKLPNLINNPLDYSIKEQGKNLFCRDTISENKEIESLSFDLVVGNPPFGTKDLLKSIRGYCDQNGFPKEMVLPFLHKAVKFSPRGEIALIFNTKVLTNTNDGYIKFRKWLFNECDVEKVYNFSILRNSPEDFGGQLFGSATGPISILFYKNRNPGKLSDRIIYYAPKTFVKSNILEGVVIDSTDIKYLPREECQRPESKIWKIAMWGGNHDINIIRKVLKKFKTLDDVFESQPDKWVKKTGLLKVNKNNYKSGKYIEPDKEIIDTNKIVRYYTGKNALFSSDKKCNPKDLSKFKAPFLLVKEGQKNWMYCSTIIEFDALFYKSAYAIKSLENNDYNKVLCALINSKFAKYYLSLISSSWGIERERVQPNEILLLPYIFEIKQEWLGLIIKLVDKIIESEKSYNLIEIPKLETELDSIFFEQIFKFSRTEIEIINETINFNLDLLENKINSAALKPETDTNQYAKTLCNELNDFLKDQQLYTVATTYALNIFSPLMMVKISFTLSKKKLTQSKEDIAMALKTIDQLLWQKKATNIYFRKKLNFKNGDDIYLIRPNQKRFWTQTSAMEDADDLILEILNEV